MLRVARLCVSSRAVAQEVVHETSVRVWARAVIEAAVAKLPPVQATVIRLRDLHGLEADEVCNVLEISESNQRVCCIALARKADARRRTTWGNRSRMKLNRDMTCAEVVELITEYLEGGLTSAQRERFEEHIGYCEWCLSYLDQMRLTIARVGELREADLPPALVEGLVDAFRGWSAEPS
jgi:hypothetical protein